MILKALLVSKDDLATETLTQVLANFGVAVDRSSAADVAVARLERMIKRKLPCAPRLPC